MRENTFVHKVTKILLDILFVLSTVCTAASYFIAKYLQKLTNDDPTVILPFTLTLLFSGALSVYILILLRRMFKTLLNDDPFVSGNVSSLRKIAVASALIALIYFIKCFFRPTFMTLAVFAAFAVATLFSLTLKDVFKRAVNLRRENDLTI